MRIVPLEMRPDGGATWGDGVDIDLADVLDGARVERPALHVREDGVVQLAVVGTTETENVVALLESTDGGRTFGPATLVSSDPALPHLSPQWAGDELVFGARGPDDAELCRWTGAAATCASVGSPRLDSFSASAATAVIDTSEGEWARVGI